MKILVMGAGAVGAYFGARLQQAGEEVIFCARGQHLGALQNKGLELISHQGDFSLAVTATDEPRRFAPYDLILFCVKSYDTADAAQTLAGGAIQVAPRCCGLPLRLAGDAAMASDRISGT